MKIPGLVGLIRAAVVACAMWIGVAGASAQSTYFADDARTLNGAGAWVTQQFTLRGTTTFALRFVADYAAQCAIFTPSQYGNFTSNRAFSGYASFNSTFGTKFVTLGAGTYYIGVRNLSSGGNTCRYELDYDLTVPGWRYTHMALQGTSLINANGGRYWHGFRVERGRRYFLDGANSGVESYVIPASELANFTAGRGFRYYPSLSGTGMDQPGLAEVRLAPGTYYLVFINRAANRKAVTYNIEAYVSRGTFAAAETEPALATSKDKPIENEAAQVPGSESPQKPDATPRRREDRAAPLRD